MVFDNVFRYDLFNFLFVGFTQLNRDKGQDRVKEGHADDHTPGFAIDPVIFDGVPQTKTDNWNGETNYDSKMNDDGM